ncbi:MAG: hypothetical protein U0836_02395 [Pirellulales bacterium]
MNARIVWRVMWKEYRALRGLWIAVAAASWTSQFAVLALSRDASWFGVAFGAALITPVFYALGAAAASFAGEREEGADRFLMSLPLSIAPLVTGKMLFLLLSTLAIVPAVALVAAVSAWWPQAEYFDADLYFIWAPAVLEVIAWGLLFSLLGRSVMQAACLGGLVAAGSVSIALWLTNDVVDQVDVEQYGNALLARLTIVGVVLLGDLTLAQHWLRGAVGEQRLGRRISLSKVRAVWPRFLARAARPLRWQGRLAWLAARQSAGMFALAIVLPIALATLIPLGDQARRYSEWSPAGETEVHVLWEGTMAFVALLVGCAVFFGDQRERRYRCLAEQGGSARSIWCSRQMIGVAALFVGIAAWHLAWWLGPMSRLGPISRFAAEEGGRYVIGWHGITARECALVAIAYGVGQAMSLLFRSSIVGTLVSVMAIVPFFLWYRLTAYFALPAIGTLWPLVAGLLATTAVFLPRWLIDRRGPTTWLRTGGTFGLFAGGVLAIVPELRLAEAPDEPIGFDVAAFQATLDGEARETAKMYWRALVRMTPLDPESERPELDRLRADAARGELDARLRNAFITDADRRWLGANEEAIDLTLAANARPTCAFVLWGFDRPTRTRADLINLLLLRGVAAENRLDASLESVRDALQLVRHVRPEPWAAARLERQALEFIAAWSVWPGQTPERLRAMDELLVDYEANLPNPDEWVKFDYLDTLEQIDRFDGHFMNPFENWVWQAPWERVRTERLLRLWTNGDLAVVDRVAQSLRDGASLDWLQDAQLAEGFDLRRRTTPHLPFQMREFSAGTALGNLAAERAARRRATRIMLDLAGYRLGHGHLPDSLEDLAATQVRELPKDPYTGLRFRYFPEGFPVRIGLGVGLGPDQTLTLDDGQPLLWSPGIQVRMTETQENGSLAPGYSMVNRDRQFERVDDLQAWTHGITFPVPQSSRNDSTKEQSP